MAGDFPPQIESLSIGPAAEIIRLWRKSTRTLRDLLSFIAVWCYDHADNTFSDPVHIKVYHHQPMLYTASLDAG